MTYRELLETLRSMDDARLDDTVTVFDPHQEEYISVFCTFKASDDNDVLDKDHLFLVLKA